MVRALVGDSTITSVDMGPRGRTARSEAVGVECVDSVLESALAKFPRLSRGQVLDPQIYQSDRDPFLPLYALCHDWPNPEG